MQETAVLNFYNVTKCGYFIGRGKHAAFGDYRETLSALISWVTAPDMPLNETCTYVVPDDEEYMRTFCLDVQTQSNGDTVLVTWNESATTDGKVGSVNGDDPVGVARVTTASLPFAASIPGYATYFWMIPERGMIATVQFGDIRNGHQNLCRYVQGFLERHSKHVRFSRNSGDAVEILGYSEGAAAALAENCHPRFESHLRRNPTEISELKKKRSKIARVVRHQVLKSNKSRDQAIYIRLMRGMGLKEAPPLADDIRTEFRFSMTPTEQQFDEMIAQASKESHLKKFDSWQDTGVIFQGEASKVHWLSSIKARVDLELDVERGSQNIVSAQSILSAIRKQRGHILNKAVK